MLLLLGVIVLGLLIGLALGGSLRALEQISFRWWGLAVMGLALQFVPIPSSWGQRGHWLAVGLLVASYAVLTVFVAANFRLPGFPLMAVGFVLNLVAVAANGGMPVSADAVRTAYGPGAPSLITALRTEGGEKHHIQRPDDILLPITDQVPVPRPFHTVLSAGDVTSMAGAAWVVAGATLPAGRRRRVRRRKPGEVVEPLAAGD